MTRMVILLKVKNPHKGGFYDEEGNWVDDSLYSLDKDGI